MSELDPELEQLVTPLRRLPEPNPYALARLRAELRRAPPVRPGWLLLSPMRAAACAALIVLATSAVWLTVVLRTPPGSVPVSATAMPVQFVFVAENARQVSVVGDFNDWDPRANMLTRTPGGMWSVVIPLEPGRFTYSFVVDGEVWHGDPAAPVAARDFGRPSSVLLVAAAETPP
jgi:hypothetical protein